MHPDDNVAAARRGVDRIGDEVRDGAPNFVRIAARRERPRPDLRADLDALHVGDRLQLLDDAHGQVVSRRRARLSVDASPAS